MKVKKFYVIGSKKPNGNKYKVVTGTICYTHKEAMEVLGYMFEHCSGSRKIYRIIECNIDTEE